MSAAAQGHMEPVQQSWVRVTTPLSISPIRSRSWLAAVSRLRGPIWEPLETPHRPHGILTPFRPDRSRMVHAASRDSNSQRQTQQ
jgi:hypothetical protein